MARCRTINVDEWGRSSIVAVNGDEEASVGRYADGLAKGDEVELSDGSVWTVREVYTHIQAGNPGTGSSNYVAVDLVRNRDRWSHHR